MYNTYTHTHQKTPTATILCAQQTSAPKMSACTIGDICKWYALQMNSHYDITAITNANLVTFRSSSSYPQGETGPLSTLLSRGGF